MHISKIDTVSNISFVTIAAAALVRASVKCLTFFQLLMME